MSEQPEVQSIRDVNANLKLIVEAEIGDDAFWIKGVVKDVYVSEINHTYFTLTENDYSIECTLSRHKRGALDFTINDETEVEVYGRVSLYQEKCRLEAI